jgi:hemoglobin
MKADIKNYSDLQLCITRFYELLATDKMLNPIFYDMLGHGNWTNHINKIADFWDTVLFAGTNYKGQSFLPHATMQLEQKHFDQWLALFAQSINENFEGPKAEEAIAKAKTMAILFMSKINYYKENGETPLL